MDHSSQEPDTQVEPVDQQVGYLVKRLQQAVRGRMDDALRAQGISLASYAALAALQRQPGLSNAALARRCFVTPQTMNQMLAALRQQGLVERSASPTHGRVLETRLTPAGERHVALAHEVAAEVSGRMLAGRTPAERDLLRDWLHDAAERLGG